MVNLYVWQIACPVGVEVDVEGCTPHTELYAHGINLGDRPSLAAGHHEIISHVIYNVRGIGVEVRLECGACAVIVLIV